MEPQSCAHTRAGFASPSAIFRRELGGYPPPPCFHEEQNKQFGQITPRPLWGRGAGGEGDIGMQKSEARNQKWTCILPVQNSDFLLLISVAPSPSIPCMFVDADSAQAVR